jgi:hypothetical protein
MTTTPTASDRGQGTAATAADQGKHLGGVAAEEAQNVAGDVAEQLRSLLDDTVQQVSEQSSVQRDRLVELLKGLSHDLHQMADASNGSGLAGQLVRGGAERAQAVSSRLDGREPSELVDEVRSFARRKPGVFLAGALVAGVVAGRFARGAKDAQDSPSSAAPVAAGDPAAQPVPRPVTGPLDPSQVSDGGHTTTTSQVPSQPVSGSTPESTPTYGDDPVTTP